MKRILSCMLCVLMIFSFSSVAFAADGDAVLKAYGFGAAEDMQAYKADIETISFTGVVPGTNAVNAGKAWDVSSSGNGSVYAWLEDDNNNGFYEAYITAYGKNIFANSNCAFLFEGYTNLKRINGSSYFRTNNVTSMEGMFMNCTSLEIVDLQYFNTSSVSTMKRMFENCKSLTTIMGLDKLDTSKVILMNNMFYGCESLETLDLSNLDTFNVTDMSFMFYNCKKLSECDFGYTEIKNETGFIEQEKSSKFSTYSVIDMSYMFSGCESLTQLNLSGFITASLKTIQKMFYGCTSLVSLDLSGWDFGNLGGKNQAMYQFISFCPSLKHLYLYDALGINAEFHDFGEDFEKTSSVKIYTHDSFFESNNLWNSVLKYMAGSSISYSKLPDNRAILTFTVPNGISFYRITEIDAEKDDDYVFSNETRSYPKNTKLKIGLYGDYSEYTFYVDGVPKTITAEESIYILVLDDAAVYAVGEGSSTDKVEDDDKNTNGDGDTATNIFGIMSIIFNRIIEFFRNLFKIG